jgi:hypothetical protein
MPTGAKRCPDGEFSRSTDRTRKQKVGDVRAGNQKHDADGSKQN